MTVTFLQIHEALGAPALKEALTLWGHAPSGDTGSGTLVIVDFAPHTHESLRQAHQHRRLGFSDEEIARWMEAAGLTCETPLALPPQGPSADNDTPCPQEAGLTVKIWRAVRTAARTRSAA